MGFPVNELQRQASPVIWSALKHGTMYFALVFSAGFVLGTIRVLALEPRIGAKFAELIEMPIMLVVIYLSAKYVVSKIQLVKGKLPYLIVGTSALALLLVFELTLVLGMQGLSLDQYLESRDSLAFSAYIMSLIIMALMPLIVSRRKHQVIPNKRMHPNATETRR